MPPMIEEDEVSGDEIPFRVADNGDDAGEEDEEDDEDDDGEEYLVDKIMSHMFDDTGALLFEVKWQGYEKKADRTWEPEENLSSAQDVLEEYFKKIGGRPKRGDDAAKKSRKRKLSEPAASASPAPSTKNRSRKSEGTPAKKPSKKDEGFPVGSWEDHVMEIETVEELPAKEDPKKKERTAYVVWNTGNKSQHPLIVVNKKCPQKMLQYYERHLVFKSSEDDEA